MNQSAATACANSNVALIKYWGNQDERLRLPANGSLSMSLQGLRTKTRVEFSAALPHDAATINGQVWTGDRLGRISRQLDTIRNVVGVKLYAEITSETNFPMDAGIASSASAFAALTLAAVTALGLQLSTPELSRLARCGSGSAARSVPGGFVEWHRGTSERSSFAETIAPAEHWRLVDLIAIVDRAAKSVGSTEGHALAASSVLQEVRVRTAPERLDRCRDSILRRDFHALAHVAELDCHLLHAVMMTSEPPLYYWRPATWAIMEAVRAWRANGLEVFYTVDAGANIHCICSPEAADRVENLLGECPEVLGILRAAVGGPACLCSEVT